MRIVEYIYGNGCLSRFLKLCFLALRLYYPYNKIAMRKMRQDADNSVCKQAQHFFLDNESRIDEICTWFSDDTSIETYQKLIRLRQYYRNEDIPRHNYFDQYYPKDIPEFSTKWSGGEVYIDCGAFNGDTVEKFVKNIKNYNKIYAFEPDDNNIRILKAKQEKIHDLYIVQAACSDKDGKLMFSRDKSGGSHVAKSNEKDVVEIPCNCIDTIIGEGECHFIKMDIEGAEWDALHGARNTIKRNKPKLAISIYHSDEDMIRLVEYIHELVPEYRLFVRAHTMGIAETILYAML